MTLPCPHCGHAVSPRLKWQPCSNKTRHIRADCPSCGRFIKYVSHTLETIAEADRNTPSSPPTPPSNPDLFGDVP